MRRFALGFGGRAGLASARLADFVLAVSEACACAATAGPGTARVRLWITGRRAFCEVRGTGMLLRRTTAGGRAARPASEEESLRRLLLRLVTDQVTVAADQGGVRVTLSMTVA